MAFPAKSSRPTRRASWRSRPPTSATWPDATRPTNDAAIVVVGPADAIAPQLEKLGKVARTTPEGCNAPGAPVVAR